MHRVPVSSRTCCPASAESAIQRATSIRSACLCAIGGTPPPTLDGRIVTGPLRGDCGRRSASPDCGRSGLPARGAPAGVLARIAGGGAVPRICRTPKLALDDGLGSSPASLGQTAWARLVVRAHKLHFCARPTTEQSPSGLDLNYGPADGNWLIAPSRYEQPRCLS